MYAIPKMIHYCWFGHNKIPCGLRKNIKSWYNKCPEYKFVLWNENNFDCSKIPFTKREYDVNNWAFVSDYVRLYALYKYGGVYLDTDVEMLKNINPFLYNDMLIGMENWNSLNSGLILGSTKHNSNIKNILNIYNRLGHKRYITKYYNTVNIITLYFRKYGFKYINNKQCVNDCNIYPTSYFCPKSYVSGKLNVTNHTYTIHHYFSSWVNKNINHTVIKHIQESNNIKKIIGPTLYRKLYKNYLLMKKLI